MPETEHRQHKGLNRAGTSHPPTRRRERMMKRFTPPGHAQRYLAIHDQVANLFRRPANLSNADDRRDRAQAFQTWAALTGAATAIRSRYGRPILRPRFKKRTLLTRAATQIGVPSLR